MSEYSVIVIGGGLSGLSAAHTVLQGGGTVCLVDKNAFMGGNSTKATSGINGCGTSTQKAMGVPDNKDIFEEDTIRGATGVKTGPCPPRYELGRVLTHNSGAGIEWLKNSFGLALDTVSRLGGHSLPRTHRSKSGGKFPGMEITYCLMQAYEKIAEEEPHRAKLITKAKANRLITNDQGAVVGVSYKTRAGVEGEVRGKSVIVASGGYAAGGLFKDSLLQKVRPDICHLATTNGTHCTGDGIQMTLDVGGDAVDLEYVQVHPTGLVNPKDPDNKVKFLAAEALRGEGGIIIDRDGKRFVNDLGTRDYVSGVMFKHNKFPYRLVLNGSASSRIDWHCRHYAGRGVMKKYGHAQELANDMGVPLSNLEDTFKEINRAAEIKNDKYGLKFFDACPMKTDDHFYVGQITPVVHYSMGGLKINGKAEVQRKNNGGTLPGLYAAGEATGGVHLKNRLGGSALLECVVYGRLSGASALEYAGGAASAVSTTSSSGGASSAPSSSSGASKAGGVYTMQEVAKHNTDTDAWVAVNGRVLNVTTFLDDHPGGKMSLMTFAGRDASEEFNMLHEKGVIDKYAPECVIGTLKATSKL